MAATRVTSEIKVGDVIVVNGAHHLGSLWMKNDMGGTCALPSGSYRVMLTKTWYDYETGQRCIGRLVDRADVEKARKFGTIDVSKYSADIMEQAKKAKAKTQFDPSEVYFSAHQVMETKANVNPVKGYSLKGVKVFQGMDGVGLNATLLRDGKAICTLIDEGSGGMMFFRWHDQKHGESKERDLWDVFIATEKEKTDNVKKDEFGRTERDYFDGEMWVNKIADAIESAKRMKRLCKTNTCFQVGKDIGGEKFNSVKGTELKIRDWVLRKYAGQTVKFLNDEV